MRFFSTILYLLHDIGADPFDLRKSAKAQRKEKCVLLRCLLPITFFLLAASLSWAGDEKKPLTRDDFAYGMELTVDGKNAIYGLSVPAQVYQGCTSADLGDLRLFNTRNIIPHLLRPQVRKENSRPSKALAFFPLVGTSGNNTLPPDLHISTNSRGTIIALRQDRTKQPSQVVTSYIIDTADLEQSPDWLEFSWSGQSDHFSTSVRLDGSDDLNSWYTLVASASLAELSFGGHDLLRNRIDIEKDIQKNSKQKKTYLRISWPEGRKGVTLSSVKAGYDKEEQKQLRTVHRITGKIDPDEEQGTTAYHYSSDGFYPVDQLYVRLPLHNSLARITVFSRPDKDALWHRRAALLSYQLTIDGVALDSEVKNITPSTDRFWRLEIAEENRGAESPILELGWLPGQLVFLAQGEEPYTLAYGRSGLTGASFQVDRLLTSIDPLKEKNLVMSAQAGPQKILGGQGNLKPSPDLPWRSWLLWAVLIAGVLLVGGMALQLLKEMNKGIN